MTYKIKEIEDSSEQEPVRVPSMGKSSVGGTKTAYLRQNTRTAYTRKSAETMRQDPEILNPSPERIKQSPEFTEENPQTRKKRCGYRLAAAGLAGALLAVNTAGAVSASQRQNQRQDAGASFIADRQNPLLSDSGFWWGNDEDTEEDSGEQSSDLLNDSDWDEEEILERWDLDPDDFPSDDEDASPDIPDEYIPYFQEVTAEAVGWYAGDTPPEADLSGYSARAYAIRKKAAACALESIRDTADRYAGISKSILSSAGTVTGQNLVSALQGDAFSRDVHTGTLTFGTGDLARTNSSDSLMTAGKPRQGRTNGPSSVSRFLGVQRDSAMQEEGMNPSEEASQTGSSSKADSASEDLHVITPAFHYLLTAPFVYNMGPAADQAQGEHAIPAPVGVYPYTRPYTPAANDPDEEDDRDDDSSDYDGADDSRDSYSEDSHSEDSHSEDSYSDGYDSDEDEDAQRESNRRILTADGNMIPFRSYGSAGEGGSSFSEQRRTVFIGDSRTVGMEMFCGGASEEYWSAKNSMGYSWMVSTGIPNVEYLIDENTDVVILMGVNDLGNVYNYIDYINMKAAEWKKLGARTFFVSVTPVDDSRSPNAKNYRIENFNAYAQENLRDVYYIDAYSRIRYSFGSPDGIHFNASTYREIYRIIEFSLYRGWYEQDGLWFYFDCGRPLTGWNYLDGQWQYMDGYGVRWVKDGRVGDMAYIPLPDFDLSGEEIIGLSF